MEKHLHPEEERQALEIPCDPAILRQEDLAGYFTPEEWAKAAHDDISLDEVRRALSTIPGSLAETLRSMRRDG